MNAVGVAPRVTGAGLGGFVDQRVTLAGRVAGEGVLESCDGQQISVECNGQRPWESQFVEVVGFVRNEGGSLKIQEERSAMLGDNFNLQNYNGLVGLIQSGKYNDIF